MGIGAPARRASLHLFLWKSGETAGNGLERSRLRRKNAYAMARAVFSVLKSNNNAYKTRSFAVNFMIYRHCKSARMKTLHLHPNQREIMVVRGIDAESTPSTKRIDFGSIGKSDARAERGLTPSDTLSGLDYITNCARRARAPR